MKEENYVAATKLWIEKTIIEYNFCPFAKKVFKAETIHFEVVDETNVEEMLTALSLEFERLNDNLDIETTILILPVGLESFFDYLDFLELANQLNHELGYEGIYQLASFHPDYCFADAAQTDPSNYTNRSPLPLIHIIREPSLEKALASYPNPESIPELNVSLAESTGSEVFESILQECNQQIK
jgi:hypothetical protein